MEYNTVLADGNSFSKYHYKVQNYFLQPSNINISLWTCDILLKFYFVTSTKSKEKHFVLQNQINEVCCPLIKITSLFT